MNIANESGGHTVQLHTAGNTFFAGGNVGIGKSATVSSSYNTYGAMNPQAPLHIYKESKGAPQDKRVEVMRLETNQYDFEGGNGGTILTMVAGNENATPAKGEIGLLNDYVSNSESDGQFQFKLRDRSGNMKEVMTKVCNRYLGC